MDKARSSGRQVLKFLPPATMVQEPNRNQDPYPLAITDSKSAGRPIAGTRLASCGKIDRKP